MWQSIGNPKYYRDVPTQSVFPSADQFNAANIVKLQRNDVAMLPLRLPQEARLAVIYPVCPESMQRDMALRPPLAQAIRVHHAYVDEFIIYKAPTESDIATFQRRVKAYDLVLLGTVNAYAEPAQADFVQALLDTAVPAITIAFCSEKDLDIYPQTQTHLQVDARYFFHCDMLALALWGQLPALHSEEKRANPIARLFRNR